MRVRPLIIIIVILLVQVAFGQAHGYRKVNAIRFAGNTAFDGATLENQFCMVKVGERVTSSIIEWDIETNIKAFFREHGYVKCGITFEEEQLTAEDINLHVMISEGSQYRLASLNITGVKTFRKDAIAAKFDIQPGEIANFKKIKEGLDAVKRLYAAYGFINWMYLVEQIFDEQNKTMALSFSIEEGFQYFIAYVAFVGCSDQAEEENMKTQTIAQPGHLFNPVLLDVDTLRLKNMLGVAVKATTEIYPDKALVGIVYWLDPVTAK
ncbi:MAG: hypothetical protein JXA73_19905 [Acidobacteria bacterium]|nr:hypothetical protein [Acidobacteriota bacterium]